MLSLALALLAAAAPARAASDPAALTFAISADVDTLDPDWAYDATSLYVDQQVYEHLVAFDGAAIDRFVPRLASVVPSAENGFASKDGLVWRFPLRGGVKFHDGTLLTPEDVRYSLLRFLLTDRDGGPSGLLLQPLLGRTSAAGSDGRPDPAAFDEALAAVGLEGGALVLRLRQPFAPLLAVLANFAPVVSKSFVAAHGGWDGQRETWARHWNRRKELSPLYAREDGTGPFRLESWDRAARRLTLARSDAYWRSPAPLRSATILTVEDPLARRTMLATGEADVAQIDATSAPAFKDVPGVVVDEGLAQVQDDDVILLNESAAAADNPWLGSGRLDGQGVPPDFFADQALRRAFALSFDYDGFVRDAYGGKALRAQGPIPRAAPGWSATKQQWNFSPEEAAKAFRDARGGAVWARGFLLPVAYQEGYADRRLACKTLEAGLARINPRFRVDCRALSQSALLGELRARRPAASVFRWVLDYPDAHNAAEPFLRSTGFFAKALSYSNPRADALIDRAAAETDPNERKRLYFELQSLAVFDLPALFTVETAGALARRAKVRNWVYNPMLPYGSLYEVTKLP